MYHRPRDHLYKVGVLNYDLTRCPTARVCGAVANLARRYSISGVLDDSEGKLIRL